MTHTKYINNWDLVDTSCESIVGAYLENLSKEPLRKFALSQIFGRDASPSSQLFTISNA